MAVIVVAQPAQADLEQAFDATPPRLATTLPPTSFVASAGAFPSSKLFLRSALSHHSLRNARNRYGSTSAPRPPTHHGTGYGMTTSSTGDHHSQRQSQKRPAGASTGRPPLIPMKAPSLGELKSNLTAAAPGAICRRKTTLTSTVVAGYRLLGPSRTLNRRPVPTGIRSSADAPLIPM